MANPKRALMALLTIPLGIALTCSGCGTALSGSSTCKEFMAATTQAQDAVVNELATKYHKPDFTTPLGRPDVNYECAGKPSMTLDQFFAAAND